LDFWGKLLVFIFFKKAVFMDNICLCLELLKNDKSSELMMFRTILVLGLMGHSWGTTSPCHTFLENSFQADVSPSWHLPFLRCSWSTGFLGVKTTLSPYFGLTFGGFFRGLQMWDRKGRIPVWMIDLLWCKISRQSVVPLLRSVPGHIHCVQNKTPTFVFWHNSWKK